MKFTKLIIYFCDIADKFNHDVLVLFSILVSIIEIDGIYAEFFCVFLCGIKFTKLIVDLRGIKFTKLFVYLSSLG